MVEIEDENADADAMPHPLRRKLHRKKIVISFEKEDEKEPIKSDPDALGDVLMVEVENVTHEEFEVNQEIRALKQEIISTIRDIVTSNPLYR